MLILVFQVKCTVGMDELMEWKHLPGSAVTQYPVSNSLVPYLHIYDIYNYVQLTTVVIIIMFKWI